MISPPAVCQFRPLSPPYDHVLSLRVDATSYGHATRTILRWASARDSRYICMSTVHMAMEAYDCKEFCGIVNSADLVTPDGMPMVWSLRLLGHTYQRRVCGPDLMIEVMAAATLARIPVGFYGGRPEVLERLLSTVKNRFPDLIVAYAESPPFRAATDRERLRTVEAINRSGTRILFVGLGCPSQERWMAEQKGHVAAVILWVGAAFDFLAGTTPRAPRWVMEIGLEWLFRLMMEPRRLWKRYFKNNPRFLVLFLLQWLRRHA